MKKKLVLMHPNQLWSKFDLTTTWRIPPQSLCRLAACVRDIVDVTILDAQIYDLSEDEVRARLTELRPDYVGISMLTSEYAATLDTAAAIAKEVDPEVVVIAGGVHVTTDFEATMANPSIDYACRGEGETLLRELLLHLEGKGPLPSEGLVYREDCRMVAQERALIPDLDALPEPAYDLVDMKVYVERQFRYGPNRMPELPGIAVTFARGCPFGCTFCQVEMISGKKIRVPSPKRVVDELMWFKQNHGIKSFVFFDDNIFAHKTAVKAICREMIGRGLGLTWSVAGFPIFCADDELIDLMVEAGCVGVNIAIESGNPRVCREIVGKPIKDLDEIPAKIKRIKGRGMFVVSNFIIGLPGESWQEILDTIDYAEHCGADYVKFFVAVPLKGTKMWNMAAEIGAFDFGDTGPQVEWRVSQLRGPDWTAQDVSILRVYEWDRINFGRDRISKTAEIWGLPPEELEKIRLETREKLRSEMGKRFYQVPGIEVEPMPVATTKPRSEPVGVNIQ